MFCTKCGHDLGEADLFCARCGKPVRPGYTPAGAAVLSRPMDRKKIAGVCAGFARYFDIDDTLMRIVWIAITVLSGGLMLLVYLAAWLLMPKDYPAPAPAGNPYASPA
jgi:phage shock protein C